MKYGFLIDTYETERVKVVSVWSMFRDQDLEFRPHSTDQRGRSVHEQMVHQCVSEDLWFRNILGIDVSAPPLPKEETRLEFMARYAEDSGKRLEALRAQTEAWWEETVQFFGVPRSRTWVMTRRMTHTSQHRGQLMAMLRMLGRDMHSTYGPTADTGGLMQNKGKTIYAYPTLEDILRKERDGGAKQPLPEPSGTPVTERPSTPSVKLREHYGAPMERARLKSLRALDEHCRRFIALSPLVCMGTQGEAGADVTPRGDKPGFVHVLDATTLAIPDWPGNNRLDSLTNIVENPQIGLLFLVPGVDESLRVNGTATITTDPAILARWQVNGKQPKSALLVKVGEAFLHCGKALIRSRLWHDDYKIDRAQLPSYGRMMKDQIDIADTAEQIEASVEQGYRERLY